MSGSSQKVLFYFVLLCLLFHPVYAVKTKQWWCLIELWINSVIPATSCFKSMSFIKRPDIFLYINNLRRLSWLVIFIFFIQVSQADMLIFWYCVLNKYFKWHNYSSDPFLHMIWIERRWNWRKTWSILITKCGMYW